MRKIRPSKHPLRKELGPLDELMASIIEKGLMSPIVVRPAEAENKFEVVAGNRRFEACRKLGMGSIPCYITEFDDKEAYESSLVENLQRKTLDPLEEARAFGRYVDDFGYGSESELARKIGKSPSYVSRRIALLRLPKRVRTQLLRSAKVGMAEELLSLDGDDKEPLIELIIKRKITTSSEVRRIIREMRNEKPLEAKSKADTSSFYALRETRQHILDRAFARYITALKLCLMRLDEIIDSLADDEWIVKYTFMQYRISINRQMESLMRLKKRTQHELPPA